MVATENGTATSSKNGTAKALEGLFGNVMERMRTHVNIGMACGEPLTVGETTIIPIGVVGYGFGMGMNTNAGTDAEGRTTPEGGGGGGGGWIQPIAIVTITNGKTKVTPVLDLARLIPAMIGAVAKLALAASERAQSKSVFGPGSMVMADRKRRRHRGQSTPPEIDEKE
jgi:uncharacterized spore protein YtfJ